MWILTSVSSAHFMSNVNKIFTISQVYLFRNNSKSLNHYWIILVTHSHLLKREDEPKCIGCDTPFAVKHFLLECTDFAAERISCFQPNNLKELFKDVPVGKILSFLRQVNLFYKI